jgi:hypothetical protein
VQCSWQAAVDPRVHVSATLVVLSTHSVKWGLATQRNKILAAVKIIKQISQRGIKIQLCVDGKKLLLFLILEFFRLNLQKSLGPPSCLYPKQTTTSAVLFISESCVCVNFTFFSFLSIIFGFMELGGFYYKIVHPRGMHLWFMVDPSQFSTSIVANFAPFRIFHYISTPVLLSHSGICKGLIFAAQRANAAWDESAGKSDW